MSEAIKAAAERIVTRIENAGNYFYCAADREEAVEIAEQEIAALGAGLGRAQIILAVPPGDCEMIAATLEAKAERMSPAVADVCRRLAAVLREPGFGEAGNAA